MQAMTATLSDLDQSLFFLRSAMIFFIRGAMEFTSFFFVFTPLKIVSMSSIRIIEGWNSFAQIMTDQRSFTN